jgi:uncharacterized protein YcbK (DUF882 family)
MLRDINYFTSEEFECPCCHVQLISQKLVSMLDSGRAAYGKPIVVNSGFRCYIHNHDVGGLPSSSHRRGLAVDIKVRNNRERYELLKIFLAVGFCRIGIGPGFIHVDIDPRKAQDIIWTY